MNKRVLILKHWLSGKRNGVSFSELVKKVFGPTCSLKARPFIQEIKTSGGLREVHLKGLDSPLYFPSIMPKTSLCQVIEESFYPDNWHYFEIEETRVDSNDIVADCGAAEGMFSLMVADRCKKVYVIEPLPPFLDSLKKTFSRFSNVEIVPCALSDKPGQGNILDRDISSTLTRSPRTGTPVKIKTMDNLFYDKGIRITYIKADLEGHEYDMLKGAIKTIKASFPKIAITTYHRADHAEKISALLKEINPNYRIRVKGVGEQAGAPVMLHAYIP
jgi:FkbM family methyltransferase